MDIKSSSNPRVKEVVRLRQRRERDASNRFLIEGYRELTRAVAGGQPLERLFICEPLFLGDNEQTLIQRIEALGTEIIACAEGPFRKMSYRDRPDGLLAIAPQQHCTLADLPRQKSSLYLIAEAIEKPGNLGTILRSADACNASGVIVCDRCTDLFNPNVVRASVGTLFTVPVVEASSDQVLSWLEAHAIQLVAATPDATLCYTDADLTGPTAIAVGCEQLGLSERLLGRSSIRVSIPMRGIADSLNVAMAATLLLYEAGRQR